MRRRVPAGAGPAVEIERLRRALDDWHPQHGLNYFFGRCDPLHGVGGRYYGGRPRRPGDPGSGDGWRWERFSAALERDRQEIAAVVDEYPEQELRLRQWLLDLEALARRRDRDPSVRDGCGSYYEPLSTLGYRYSAAARTANNDS